jgi:hypothetical protein
VRFDQIHELPRHAEERLAPHRVRPSRG